jgi:excisionase family DNA binding protein
MIETEWMTAKEAADYLRVPVRTFLVWVRRGQIKGYSLSGTKRHVRRFLKVDLDAALGITAITKDVVNYPASSAVHVQ